MSWGLGQSAPLEVFVLFMVTPYDSTETLGVYGSLIGAQTAGLVYLSQAPAHLFEGKVWYIDKSSGSWTTDCAGMESYLQIERVELNEPAKTWAVT